MIEWNHAEIRGLFLSRDRGSMFLRKAERSRNSQMLYLVYNYIRIGSINGAWPGRFSLLYVSGHLGRFLELTSPSVCGNCEIRFAMDAAKQIRNNC